MPYRVVDWELNFENNRSRRIDRCSFVCTPNKQHGIGLLSVLAEPDGLSVYGVWNLIIGALSHQKRPRAGWLTDDGKETGRPWTAAVLARRWRRTADEIERAIAVLTDAEVGWIVGFAESKTDRKTDEKTETKNSPKRQRSVTSASRQRQHDVTSASEECPSSDAHVTYEEKRREELIPAMKTRTSKSSSSSSSEFEKFWKSLPPLARERSSKKQTLAEWKKQKLDDVADAVSAAVKAFSASKKWQDGYIPAAHRWLSSKKWTEPPEDVAAQSGDIDETVFQRQPVTDEMRDELAKIDAEAPENE